MSEVGNAQEKEEKDGGAFEQEEEVAIGELMETGVELEEGGSEEAIDLGASCASDLHQDPLYLQEVESQLESFWVEHMAAQQQQAAAASVLAVTTRGEGGGRKEGIGWKTKVLLVWSYLVRILCKVGVDILPLHHTCSNRSSSTILVRDPRKVWP